MEDAWILKMMIAQGRGYIARGEEIPEWLWDLMMRVSLHMIEQMPSERRVW